ncbi:MAG TPA: hypothetical protein EYN68_04210 [Candidatus Marinimicrobia bacterium]|nr:hypothetical protein [Candidatus Neomarinimicrobiota bacterium]
MRHTFATYHAIKGISEQKLAKLMGHSSTKMVARYSHLKFALVKSIVISLNKLSLMSLICTCLKRKIGTRCL